MKIVGDIIFRFVGAIALGFMVAFIAIGTYANGEQLDRVEEDLVRINQTCRVALEGQ
jgi:hypothetical protein